MNRLELVAETLRAALNAVATVAPEWMRAAAPPDWYERYARRIEEYRLPEAGAERDAYGPMVGADGYTLLDALDAPGAPPEVAALPAVATLRAVWARHFERPHRPPERGEAAPSAEPPAGSAPAVRLRDGRTLPRAAEGLESPYENRCRVGCRAPLSPPRAGQGRGARTPRRAGRRSGRRRPRQGPLGVPSARAHRPGAPRRALASDRRPGRRGSQCGAALPSSAAG